MKHIFGEDEFLINFPFYDFHTDEYEDEIDYLANSVKKVENEIKVWDNAIDNLERLKVIKNDSNISDLDFYHLYSSLYTLEFNDDFINSIAKSIFGDNAKKISIKTNEPCEYIDSEGHGRDFSWWTVRGLLQFDAFAEKGLKFDSAKIYSKKEIFDLIRNKKIILTERKVLHKEISIETYEKLKESNDNKLLTLKDFFNDRLSDKDFSLFLEWYPDFIKIIRNNLSNEEIENTISTLNKKNAAILSKIKGTCTKRRKFFQEMLNRYTEISEEAKKIEVPSRLKKKSSLNKNVD